MEKVIDKKRRIPPSAHCRIIALHITEYLDLREYPQQFTLFAEALQDFRNLLRLWCSCVSSGIEKISRYLTQNHGIPTL
jgi:hypothetical protein